MDDFFDRVKNAWEALKRYFREIGHDWQENRRPKAVGKVILPLVPVILVGLLVAACGFRGEELGRYCLLFYHRYHACLCHRWDYE